MSDEVSLYRVDRTTGKAHLSLHEAQSRVWNSSRRYVFFVAGTQSGKTSFGPWWLFREIQTHGAGDYLAVSATYDLFKLKMLPELRRVLEDVLGVGRYWSGDKVIEIRNLETGHFDAKRADDPMWARIILRSASAEGGLESASAKAAWLDECGQDDFKLEAWDAVRRRLSLSRGRVLGTTTPYNTGWLKVEVLDKALAGDSRFTVVQAESRVNPAFSDEEFEEARTNLPGWKFDMFYRGIVSRPPSLIYGSYIDEAREAGGHLVAAFPIPPEWPRYVGVDFGAVNTATLWFAHDPATNVCYAYRETHEGGKTTSEHCQAFLERAVGENLVMVFGGAPSEQQQRWDWAAAGVAVQQPMVAEVEIGIDRMIGLFKQRRVYVFDTLRIFRSQLGEYGRVMDENGLVTEKIKNKEQYHQCDAARYVAPWLTHLEAATSAARAA